MGQRWTRCLERDDEGDHCRGACVAKPSPVTVRYMKIGPFLDAVRSMKSSVHLSDWAAGGDNFVDATGNFVKLITKSDVVRCIERGDLCGGVGAGRQLGQLRGDQVCEVHNLKSACDKLAWEDPQRLGLVAMPDEHVLLCIGAARSRIYEGDDNGGETVVAIAEKHERARRPIAYRANFLAVDVTYLQNCNFPGGIKHVWKSIAEAHRRAVVDFLEQKKREESIPAKTVRYMKVGPFLNILDTMVIDGKYSQWANGSEGFVDDSAINTIRLMSRSELVQGMLIGEFCAGAGAGYQLSQLKGEQVCLVNNTRAGVDIAAWRDVCKLAGAATDDDQVLLCVGPAKDRIYIGEDNGGNASVTIGTVPDNRPVSIRYRANFLAVDVDYLVQQSAPWTVDDMWKLIKVAHRRAVVAFRSQKDKADEKVAAKTVRYMKVGPFLSKLGSGMISSGSFSQWASGAEHFVDSTGNEIVLMARSEVVRAMQTGAFCGGAGAGRQLSQLKDGEVCLVNNVGAGADIAAWQDISKLGAAATDDDQVLLCVGAEKENIVRGETSGDETSVVISKQPTDDPISIAYRANFLAIDVDYLVNLGVPYPSESEVWRAIRVAHRRAVVAFRAEEKVKLKLTRSKTTP